MVEQLHESLRQSSRRKGAHQGRTNGAGRRPSRRPTLTHVDRVLSASRVRHAPYINLSSLSRRSSASAALLSYISTSISPDLARCPAAPPPDLFAPAAVESAGSVYLPRVRGSVGGGARRPSRCDETTRTETMLQSGGDTKVPSSPWKKRTRGRGQFNIPLGLRTWASPSPRR